jgi:pyridoxal phosphate enzyme (YggS family)
MSIAQNLQLITDTLPGHVRLCAISKTHPIEIIMEAYRAGQRIFGENKVQELMAKAQQMPDDIEWHFIGHLQSNKVKQAVKYSSMIQSVDRLELMEEIENEARKQKKKINVLLEFHIAEEDTKQGFGWKDCQEALRTETFQAFRFIQVCGVMGMASLTDDREQIAREFAQLRKHFEALKTEFFQDVDLFRDISMGMSDDYPLAIQEGSTIIRVGTAIFGDRRGPGPVPHPSNFF